MLKKLTAWKTKGMNRDMSVSAFNPEFAFENKNLRLSTNEGNTLMSWVNEKGTKPIIKNPDDKFPLSLNGCAIGTAILNEYLVIFLTKCCEHIDTGSGVKVNYYDSIYRLKYVEGGEPNQMEATRLYKGNLGFSIEHPIETLVSYESAHIQKVYWTDGVNQPRLINISPENDDRVDGINGKPKYVDTSFDFIPTLQLKETVKVKKILGGGGMFAPGVIQYAFTYYTKYGQESNVFYTTPLYYISYADRGASPEDKVDNAFKIVVKGIDSNFDYLRIYSIQRTSINSTPICKRVQDIEITLSGLPYTMPFGVSDTDENKDKRQYYATFTDKGLNGDSIDPMELLFKGGNIVQVGTLEQKDNILFMGNLFTPNNELPDITINPDTLQVASRKFYPTVVSTYNYEYASQLTSYDSLYKDNTVPCAGFKTGNIYRCGVQFQDVHGRWTDPIFIGNKEIANVFPSVTVNNQGGSDEESANDLRIEDGVTITNNSTNIMTISSLAYFALNEPKGTKIAFTIILGDFEYQSIEVGQSASFPNAVIREGKRYVTQSSDFTFCTIAEGKELGLSGNVDLRSSSGKTKIYTLNVGEGSHCIGVELNCTASPEPDPIPSVDDTVISINVNMTNATGQEVTLDGDLYFVLGNPNKDGSYPYPSYTGTHIKTGHIPFNGTSVTFGVGETKTFKGLKWNDDGVGLGKTSPINPALLPGGYHHNVAVYVGGSGEVVYCNNMDHDLIFLEGGTYNIVLQSVGENPDPSPGPAPTPTGDKPVVRVNVNITNSTTESITLDGRLRFMLGNPDHNGNIFGSYGGPYVRTDNIWFGSNEYLAPGETKTFSGLTWQDGDTGCGLGESSPLSPSYLPIYNDEGGIAYARNVLLYVGERSDLVLCDNMSESIIFREGETYNLNITYPNPATTRSTRSVAKSTTRSLSRGAVGISLTITNPLSYAVTLDGYMRFILANPDKNGIYYGWEGPYNRTERITFCEGGTTLGAGDSQTFTVYDSELEGRSPADPSVLSADYPRNVLIYIGGNSETMLANNLDPSIVFDNGSSCTVTLTSQSGHEIHPNEDPIIIDPDSDDPGNSGGSGSSNGSSNSGSAKTMEVSVPIIQGTITSEDARKLYKDGYRKVRAVVVYPDISSRRVICQGVVNPTLYTKSHRGIPGGENPTKDLYAQSSWFFRPFSLFPKFSSNSDVNVPYSTPNVSIGYIDNSDSNNKDVPNNINNIKRAEIQGHFEAYNKFIPDWSTLTFHSPDVEFDSNVQVIDYDGSSLETCQVGAVNFVATMSDIDIQTETPTISDTASGFIKKSYVKDNAAGIISGLFYEDFAVNDGIKDKAEKFEAFDKQSAAMKWMVYLWNKNGSLNNDIQRPANCGVASAVLKKKIVSNLRFANTTYSSISNNKAYKMQLFLSDETEMLKLDTGNSTYSNIYMGNVDTILSPDKPYSMYFALSDLPYDKDGQNYDPPLFTANITWKTFAKSNDKSVANNNPGVYNYRGGSWKRGTSNFSKDLGDEFVDLVIKKDSIRMKYKSTPHLVLTNGSTLNKENDKLPVVEIRRPFDTTKGDDPYGGTSEDIKKEHVWIPCGEPVSLWDGKMNGENKAFKAVNFLYEWGDTYYQRWDCLKTYAFTPEDINQVVEIGSFMLETYVNIDGRYDRNRGQLSNLYMSPRNFNLLNPVYSQLNNFFTYRIQGADAYKNKYFPNQITWSRGKTSGADVDLWANVTLASILEIDGDKGDIKKLIRFNDQLLCFQDRGLSQVLYNENVLVSSTDGVPIEIANSGKVQGKRYISDSIGCFNKWSISSTPSCIYFMDDYSKAIYAYNGQLNNLSGSLGMNTWCKKALAGGLENWTPSDYIASNGTASGEPVEGFKNFVSYYDKQNQDVLFTNNEISLAFSERLNVFTSFYDYGHSPYFCNLQDTGVWVRIGAEEYEDVDTRLHIEYSTRLWQHQKGKYCNFFDENKSYWMTLIGNPDPQTDKIFTNLEFRASVEGDGELNRDTGKFTPALPFDSLEVWDEYQHGITSLENMRGHSAMMHHTLDGHSSLKRKFRIWRCDIPRDNYKLDGGKEIDPEKGISRYQRKPNDRMRNPWLYLKLLKDPSLNMQKTEIHDVLMTYFD